jgi:hypothetical protein
VVSEGKGRLFRRKDDKYLLYLPVYFAEDSMFPFPMKNETHSFVKVSFKMGKKELLVEEWVEESSKDE